MYSNNIELIFGKALLLYIYKQTFISINIILRCWGMYFTDVERCHHLIVPYKCGSGGQTFSCYLFMPSYLSPTNV